MKKIIALFVTGLLLLIGAGAFYLFSNGLVWFNNPSSKDFPVRGVDVSKYQGEIDWDVLAGQGIQFAFVKATEGSSSVDERFENNLAGAQSTNLAVGCYHFFSFDSSGSTQAANFMRSVPKDDSLLAPVIDIELYGKYKSSPAAKREVLANLDQMIQLLQARYGKLPILYATEESYNLYIKERYRSYPIWIRSVITAPKKYINWTFWQFTPRATLAGYQGEEKFIDMNVFHGDAQDFEQFQSLRWSQPVDDEDNLLEVEDEE